MEFRVGLNDSRGITVLLLLLLMALLLSEAFSPFSCCCCCWTGCFINVVKVSAEKDERLVSPDDEGKEGCLVLLVACSGKDLKSNCSMDEMVRGVLRKIEYPLGGSGGRGGGAIVDEVVEECIELADDDNDRAVVVGSPFKDSPKALGEG
jgi:hypothetical protein